MSFHPRARGTTIRRAEEYLRNPHPVHERFDADFEISMRCADCGKLAYGKRSLMREAMEEHKRSDCSARHTRPDAPVLMQILYPRQ